VSRVPRALALLLLLAEGCGRVDTSLGALGDRGASLGGTGGGPGDLPSAPPSASPDPAAEIPRPVADPCASDYPLGPYGILEGDVLDPSLVWEGYPEGSFEPSGVPIASYFDPGMCDGEAVLVVLDGPAWDLSYLGISLSYANKVASSWVGARVVQLLTESKQHAPATFVDASSWATENGLTWAVGADPARTLLLDGEEQVRLVVDGCSMRILQRSEGMDIDATVEGLLAREACEDP
jgi:hypothetical protein